jgi:hypothetical protein
LGYFFTRITLLLISPIGYLSVWSCCCATKHSHLRKSRCQNLVRSFSVPIWTPHYIPTILPSTKRVQIFENLTFSKRLCSSASLFSKPLVLW